MHVFEVNGIVISCNEPGNNCYVDVSFDSEVDQDLYNLLSPDQKKTYNDILNNTMNDYRRRRTELNNFFNNEIQYSKILSAKINKKVEDQLEKSGIYDPCFPYCKQKIEQLKDLPNNINRQVHENLRKSGIYEECFPFCNKNGNQYKRFFENTRNNVHQELKRSGIYDPCFPFCNNSKFKNSKF
ncbi:Hypothetical protein SRAE_2000082100 [Strongyloides ratti]|uniref:Uncharacterized protein n=1 Tax=Strongyloides ratti TaxID=34506 RepID=A0A090L8R0_STRRB|nr:Hypothetical protein SRAE_2000082100 [Strongyloides ratti]CEF66151.1 Hypothetical protein SRAE_2000082100 [Strongyloides ratti]